MEETHVVILAAYIHNLIVSYSTKRLMTIGECWKTKLTGKLRALPSG